MTTIKRHLSNNEFVDILIVALRVGEHGSLFEHTSAVKGQKDIRISFLIFSLIKTFLVLFLILIKCWFKKIGCDLLIIRIGAGTQQNRYY